MGNQRKIPPTYAYLKGQIRVEVDKVDINNPESTCNLPKKNARKANKICASFYVG